MIFMVILCPDIDAFHAQMEQRDNKDLRNKPVVTRLDKSEVISSASYEAKKFGIKSGMKIWDASCLCPDIMVVDITPKRFEEYAEVSKRFCEICIRHCNEFEPYGVTLAEEGWLDYKDKLSWEEALLEARRLQDDVWNEIQLTVTVGIGDSKFTSKFASDLYKPNGLGIVTKENFPDVAWHLETRKLWNAVGPSTEKKLKKLGINTIGEIA